MPCRPRTPCSSAIRRAGSWRRCCSGRSSASAFPRFSPKLFLFHQILAEWRRRRKLFAGRLYISPFARQILGDRPPQGRIGDEMRGIGGVRQVAARQLVFALRAGFDAAELMGDRKVDRLIIAQLEMQKRMVLDGTPVAAIERVGADEVDGAGDPA